MPHHARTPSNALRKEETTQLCRMDHYLPKTATGAIAGKRLSSEFFASPGAGKRTAQLRKLWIAGRSGCPDPENWRKRAAAGSAFQGRQAVAHLPCKGGGAAGRQMAGRKRFLLLCFTGRRLLADRFRSLERRRGCALPAGGMDRFFRAEPATQPGRESPGRAGENIQDPGRPASCGSDGDPCGCVAVVAVRSEHVCNRGTSGQAVAPTAARGGCWNRTCVQQAVCVRSRSAATALCGEHGPPRQEPRAAGLCSVEDAPVARRSRRLAEFTWRDGRRGQSWRSPDAAASRVTALARLHGLFPEPWQCSGTKSAPLLRRWFAGTTDWSATARIFLRARNDPSRRVFRPCALRKARRVLSGIDCRRAGR